MEHFHTKDWTYFNSIKVRLKRIEYAEAVFGLFYFNSIKVRLKRTLLSGEKGQKPQFQFHKGTIKTIPQPSLQLSDTRFQFHKGTIKTLQRQRAIHRYLISIP